MESPARQRAPRRTISDHLQARRHRGGGAHLCNQPSSSPPRGRCASQARARRFPIAQERRTGKSWQQSRQSSASRKPAAGKATGQIQSLARQEAQAVKLILQKSMRVWRRNRSIRCIVNKAELLCSSAGAGTLCKHCACVRQESGRSRVVPVLSSPRARSGNRYQEET